MTDHSPAIAVLVAERDNRVRTRDANAIEREHLETNLVNLSARIADHDAAIVALDAAIEALRDA